MSNYDNGFKAAQRSYDMQEPPESFLVECLSCAGGINEEGDICKRCDGDGCVAVSKEEYKRRMKEAKAEEDASLTDTEV